MVKKLAVEEGQKIIDGWSSIKIVEVKDHEALDIATNLDREVEGSLVKQLSTIFPEAGFELEERESFNKDSEYKWVIDPIDGTKWFATGVPLFAISIGLMKGDEPVLGVIYNPVSRQLYTGSDIAPAELNGKRVSVSKIDTLQRTMLSVDFSKIHDEWPTIREWVVSKMAALTHETYRIRSLGSGALSLAWVASGSIMNAYTTLAGATKLVDVAAGLAICKAAGATILQRKNPINNKTEFIVGHEKVVNEISKIIFS